VNDVNYFQSCVTYSPLNVLTFVVPVLVDHIMQQQTDILSDQIILSMIAENNLEAWAHLYDKYAPAMLGIICNLTDERKIAEEIFKEAFLQLKEKQILSKFTYALCPYLLIHTNTFARAQLKERGISYSNNTIDETSLINILCSQNRNITEVASKFRITTVEARNKLRSEFVEIRSKNTNVISARQ